MGKSFQIKPNKPTPLKNQSNIFGEESSSDSDDDFKKQFPFSPQELENQAINAIQQGNASIALNKFTQLISHPDSDSILKSKAHDMVAQILMDLNQLTRAIAHCEQAIALEGESYAWLHQTLGRAQRNLGELSAAKLSFEKACAMDGNEEEYKSDLAEVTELIEKMEQPYHCERYLVEGSELQQKHSKLEEILHQEAAEAKQREKF